MRTRDENAEEVRKQVRAHLLKELNDLKEAHPEIDFRRLSPEATRVLDDWKVLVKELKTFSMQGLSRKPPIRSMRQIHAFSKKLAQAVLI